MRKNKMVNYIAVVWCHPNCCIVTTASSYGIYYNL